MTSAGFRRVKTPRAFEEIAKQIRSELSSGRLRVGDRLPAERNLAEQFGVSRNTLREALRSLEHAGLLRLKKGVTGGSYIQESTGEAVISGLNDMYALGAIQPKHLTEARVIISTEVARLACARRTKEDLAKLEENITAAEEATASGDLERRAEVNYEFHRLLARATGNPVLIIITDALMAATRSFIEAIGYQLNTYVLPSRRRLLAALQARDAEAAANEMKGMLVRLQRFHLARFKENAGKRTP